MQRLGGAGQIFHTWNARGQCGGDKNLLVVGGRGYYVKALALEQRVRPAHMECRADQQYKLHAPLLQDSGAVYRVVVCIFTLFFQYECAWGNAHDRQYVLHQTLSLIHI